MAGYNFADLAIDEAFTFPIDGQRDEEGKLIDLKRVRQAASQHKRRTAPDGWQYTVRKVSDTQGECRRLA